MPSLRETLSLALHAFWRLLTRQPSTTLINKTVGVGVRKPATTTRQPPVRPRFSWSYLLVLFLCGRRPARGDSSFYADGDLEAGQGGLSTINGPQDGDVRREDSLCEEEFVNIDLNDGKPQQQQRPRGTSQSREPSSFMPPKFFFPVPIPSIEKDNDQQENPSPPLVLSDILDQFPLPPTSHPRIHKKDTLRSDSNTSLNLKLASRFPLPRPLTPILDFDPNDTSLSSFSSEFESMLSLSYEGSSSSSCFSSSPPTTPLSPFTPRTPLSPFTPTTPLSAVLPAWCEYHTSNIAKREEAYRKMKLKKKLGEKEREREEVHSTKRARDGFLSRSKSPTISGEPEEDVDGSDVAGQGHGAKKREQNIDQKVRQEASHSEKDARSDAADKRSKSESQDEAETLRNFKILPKPIRPPLRVFIPGHKRSPPIFTLPDNLFIPEDEDAYADQSYTTQPHAQYKPIDISAPRVLRKSSSKSHVQLRRTISDAKHDMSNVLRAFNEMVLGTEEDFRTLFEGESLSTSLSLVSRDTTRTLDISSGAEERFNSDILPASLSRSRTGKTSMASRLARAHSISAHARTQKDAGGDGREETSSLTSDEFDEEKMAPEEWFDMLGLDEYLA